VPGGEGVGKRSTKRKDDIRIICCPKLGDSKEEGKRPLFFGTKHSRKNVVGEEDFLGRKNTNGIKEGENELDGGGGHMQRGGYLSGEGGLAGTPRKNKGIENGVPEQKK